MWASSREHYTVPLYTPKSNESFLINFTPYDISPSEQSAILDRIFHALPTGYDSHRGFMMYTLDGKTYCELCDEIIDAPIYIQGHIETQVHAQNVISFLKSFLSEDRFFELRFVSVNGKNLLCSICLGEIDLSSKNPHETLINIFNHNSSECHDLSMSSSDPRLMRLNRQWGNWPSF